MSNNELTAAAHFDDSSEEQDDDALAGGSAAAMSSSNIVKWFPETSSLVGDHLSGWCLQQRLAHEFLQIKDVKSDGNCLFRSISVMFYGDENRHEELRQKAHAWLCEHTHLLPGSPEQKQELLDLLKTPQGWGSQEGDHWAIVALCHVLNVNIVVVSSVNHEHYRQQFHVGQQSLGEQQQGDSEIIIGNYADRHFVATEQLDADATADQLATVTLSDSSEPAARKQFAAQRFDFIFKLCRQQLMHLVVEEERKRLSEAFMCSARSRLPPDEKLFTSGAMYGYATDEKKFCARGQQWLDSFFDEELKSVWSQFFKSKTWHDDQRLPIVLSFGCGPGNELVALQCFFAAMGETRNLELVGIDINDWLCVFENVQLQLSLGLGAAQSAARFCQGDMLDILAKPQSFNAFLKNACHPSTSSGDVCLVLFSFVVVENSLQDDGHFSRLEDSFKTLACTLPAGSLIFVLECSKSGCTTHRSKLKEWEKKLEVKSNGYFLIVYRKPGKSIPSKKK